MAFSLQRQMPMQPGSLGAHSLSGSSAHCSMGLWGHAVLEEHLLRSLQIALTRQGSRAQSSSSKAQYCDSGQSGSQAVVLAESSAPEPEFPALPALPALLPGPLLLPALPLLLPEPPALPPLPAAALEPPEPLGLPPLPTDVVAPVLALPALVSSLDFSSEQAATCQTSQPTTRNPRAPDEAMALT